MIEKVPPLLIVEDDLALQKQIKWSLDRFESVVASDRESALVQCRRHSPAVVTMDSHGNSLHKEVFAESEAQLAKLL